MIYFQSHQFCILWLWLTIFLFEILNIFLLICEIRSQLIVFSGLFFLKFLIFICVIFLILNVIFNLFLINDNFLLKVINLIMLFKILLYQKLIFLYHPCYFWLMNKALSTNIMVFDLLFVCYGTFFQMISLSLSIFDFYISLF